MDTTITNIPDNILTQSYPGEIVVTMDSNSSPICRACLADKNLQSLFIEQKQLSENENLILKMFISCTALDVSPDDEYPKYICDLCLRDLYKAYEFWTKCRNSLQELDKLKGKIQNVYIKEEFKPLDDQKDADTNICDDDKVVIDVQNKNVHAKLNSKVFRKTRVKKVKGDQNDAGIVKQELDDVIELDVLSNHSNHSYHDDIDNISNCEYNIHNDIKKEPQDSNNLHKCTTCNKSYKSLYYLNMHKKKHSGEQVKPTSSIIHLCQLCGVVLASSRNLREHLESHGDLRKYTCKTCGKSYKTKRTLYAHMEIHSIEKRHTCEHCGEKFKVNHSLKCHIKRRHSNEKPYVCHFCSKAFKFSYKLTEHVRQHTGEKPYPCKECTMAFTNAARLNEHMLKHTGIRNYSCQICDKRFLKPQHLRVHMVTHTGECRHKCKICEKAFKYQQMLKNHMKVHSEEPIM